MRSIHLFPHLWVWVLLALDSLYRQCLARPKRTMYFRSTYLVQSTEFLSHSSTNMERMHETAQFQLQPLASALLNQNPPVSSWSPPRAFLGSFQANSYISQQSPLYATMSLPILISILFK